MSKKGVTRRAVLLRKRSLLRKRTILNKRSLKQVVLNKRALTRSEKTVSKRGKVVEEDFSEDNDDTSSTTSSVESGLEIQLDFEATGVSEGDYHGIRRLLQQLLLKAPVNLSDITSDIINQSDMGSVIKTCDDSADDNDVVYGITTALINKKISPKQAKYEEGSRHETSSLWLSLKLVTTPEYNKELYDFIIKRCKEVTNDKTVQQLQLLLTNPGHIIGLVFHERFLNIPVDIGPPLLQCLVNEIYTKSKDNLPTHFVLMSRSHSSPCCLISSKKKKKNSYFATNSTELIFDFQEIEYFKKGAILEFSYPVEDQDTVHSGKWSHDDETLSPYRSVLVLTCDSFCKVVKKITLELTANLSTS